MPSWKPDRTVSFSELNAFRHCEYKWWLQNHNGLAQTAEKPALSTGSSWHRGLAAHYGALMEGVSDRRALGVAFLTGINTKERDSDVLPDPERVEILKWMYDGHLQRWGADPEWTVLSVEERLVVPFYTSAAGESVGFKLFSDLRVRKRDTGAQLIVDHKSKSGRDLSANAVRREFQLEDQFGLYQWAYGLSGQEIDYTVYSAARTDRLKRAMTLEERFARTPMYRTENELSGLWQDAIRASRRMDEVRADPDRMFSFPDPEMCRRICSFADVHLMARTDPNRSAVEIALGYGFHQLPWAPALKQGQQ